MKIFKRLRNLWELSAETETKKELPRLPKRKKAPPKEVFVPRVTRDPVQEIINQQHAD